jgi:hypothetical protein
METGTETSLQDAHVPPGEAADIWDGIQIGCIINEIGSGQLKYYPY